MKFLSIQDIVFMVLAVISVAAWILIYFSTMKYSNLFETLDSKKFRLKDLYFTGYGMLERFNYDYKTKKNRDLKKQLEVLYGEKYSDYYLRVIRSQQLTAFMICIPIAFIFYGLSSEYTLTIVILALGAFLGYYLGQEPKKEIDERSDQLMGEFSEVVSKLALLTDAGMILREAWEEIAYSDEGMIYSEMILAVDEMNNGISDVEAIRHFGNRCMVPEIKKFTSTLMQGMTKGNKELSIMLAAQTDEVWNLKRQLVKRKGEEAQSKLLVPMILMFVGIMIMVMIPIFANLGVS